METIALHNPAPVAQADRIKTIDLIRGFALLGILLMNIPGFGINWDAWYNILHGPHNTKDFYTLSVISTFFEGTMRGLFSMLFGAGMILFTQNKKELPDGPSVAEFYYRRMLWLVVFGMFNAYILLWFGDILYYYGMCGMILFLFRKTNPKWLFALAIVCMFITMFKNQQNWNEPREQRRAYLEAVQAQKDSVKLKPEQQGSIAAWQQIESRRNQPPDTFWMNRNVTKMRSDYATVFTYWVPMNADSETNGLYHQWFWDGLTMMFVGMALLGLGFFSNKLSTSTYVMWLLIGYGIGIPIGYLAYKQGMLMQVENFTYYIDRYRMTPDLLYDIRRGFIAVGHASLLILVYRSKIVPWLMRALANVGQMAFTNYLMQSIICSWFFFGYGFGFYNKLKFHELYYVVFAVWVFQLIVSSIWLKYFRFGPFEWVWRSLTYWKKQPMKR
jgi:uncharacterized protein